MSSEIIVSDGEGRRRGISGAAASALRREGEYGRASGIPPSEGSSTATVRTWVLTWCVAPAGLILVAPPLA